MGLFETNHIRQDFKDLLAELEIPIDVYQRLEFLFRQALIQSPAAEFDYAHYEERIDFSRAMSAVDLREIVDKSLENWSARYPDREYGFEVLQISEEPGRVEARNAYRLALKSFQELFAAHPVPAVLQESWLKDLASNLSYQVTTTPTRAFSQSDYLACYIAFAQAIFAPYFERHFGNRRWTSEKFYEFLATKMSLEFGRFVHLPEMTLPIDSLTNEPHRLRMLPEGWIEILAAPTTLFSTVFKTWRASS